MDTIEYATFRYDTVKVENGLYKKSNYFFYSVTGRPQSTFSQRESRKHQAKLPRSLCSSSPNIPNNNSELIAEYPYKQAATIYAQGSRRNLILVNGRIRTNPFQEEVEEKLLSHCV